VTGTRQQVLSSRAAALARPLEESDTGEVLELVVLLVGDRRVALPVASLREVRPPGPVARIPGAHGALAGVVAGHGEALAVADLAAVLRQPARAAPDTQWLAVLAHPTAPLGLLVDSADDVVALPARELSSAPEPGGTVLGVAPDGLLVLDPAALLDDPRLFLSSPDTSEEPV
jgi:purine-binding chemotaxis protein CheW